MRGEGIAGTNPTLSAIINPIESSRYMHQLGPACLRRAERRFRHAEHAKTVLVSHNVHGTHVADPPSHPLGKTVDDCGDLRCRMTTREAPMLRSPLRDHSFLKSGGLNFSVDHMLDRRCELLHESPMKSRRSLALGASAVGSQEGLAPWNSRVAWLPHVGPHVDGCDARGAVRIGLLNSRRRAETLRAVHGRMAPHRPSDGLTGDGLGTCARRQTSEVGARRSSRRRILRALGQTVRRCCAPSPTGRHPRLHPAPAMARDGHPQGRAHLADYTPRDPGASVWYAVVRDHFGP